MSASQPTISSIWQSAGSYNWTHSAAHRNEENLVLTTGDAELARHLLREFARLTGQPEAPAADPTGQRVLKRLAVVQSLLALAETDDLPKHVERLEAEDHPDRVASAQQVAATAAFQQVQAAYQRQDVAALQAHLAGLRQGCFTAAPAPTSVAALTTRRDALAARHAALLRELTELRATEAFQLVQAGEAAQASYLATNRAALLAERDRLRALVALLAGESVGQA